jgi:hypothetical protein
MSADTGSLSATQRTGNGKAKARDAARHASEEEPAASEEASPTDGAPERHRCMILVHQPRPSARDGQIDRGLFRKLADLLDEVEPPRDETEIDLWLESPGGDAHAAYKIALLLRSRARKLRVVIPDYAKSAATLLALAADEIYMAPAAELGPLDAQIGYEQESMTISALDIARSLEDLANQGISMALAGGAAVLDATDLPRDKSLSTMVDFATKFMAPVIDKLDPTKIHWSTSLLNTTAQYAHRLLRMREGVNDPLPEKLRDLPDVLAGGYPAHGFIICRGEARELGLPIVDLEEYEYCDDVARISRMLGKQRVNLIKKLDLDQDEAAVDEEHSG